MAIMPSRHGLREVDGRSCTEAVITPGGSLLDAAPEAKASLTVVGARGAGEAGPLGSTTSRLLQHATMPVLVVAD